MVGRVLRGAWPPMTLVVGVGALTLIASQIGSVQGAATEMLINMVLVIGLWIFVGNSGVLSFGHISFMAIGAYVAGILSIPPTTREFLLPNLPGLLGGAPSSLGAVLIAVGVVVVFALAVGVPLMRLSGAAAAIATLSLFVIVSDVLQNWSALTGGTGTITGIPITTDVGNAFAVAALMIVVAYVFSMSATSRRLRATREDLVAAQALGITSLGPRLIAFALSAAVIAVGASLYVHYVGSISTGAFSFQLTFIVIAMLVVGGTRSLSGAVVGTISVTILTEIFRRLEDAGTLGSGWATVVVAAAVILVLALRPQGIAGGMDLPFPTVLKGSKLTSAAGGPSGYDNSMKGSVK